MQDRPRWSRIRDQSPGGAHTPEELVAKLRQVDVLVSQGKSVAEAVPSIGATPLPGPAVVSNSVMH